MAKTRAERLAELDAQRKAIEAEPDDDDDDEGKEYEFGEPGGHYARVPVNSKVGRKLHGFFKEKFGIDLDDEPVQDDQAGDDDAGKDDKGRKAQGRQQQGGQVRAFRGRGVG